MFLRRLCLDGYGIFGHAEFDLTTDVDHPIVLLTGNNGAGKTSILEALRVALHGRRAFDTPVGEQEYLSTMASRFHVGGDSDRASLALDFDYVDVHATRRVELERSWTRKRQAVRESLAVRVDGRPLAIDDAEDLLGSILPPEIARYFFFDGERIRELAEWDADDESALFAAVADILGLGVLERLRSDLLRLSISDARTRQVKRDAATALCEAEEIEKLAAAEVKIARTAMRKIRISFERARAELRRVGAMRHDEVAELDRELADLVAERRSLFDEAQRAAADVLPLLCARTLRMRFGAEIEARKEIEDRSIVTQFIEGHAPDIVVALRKCGLKTAAAKDAMSALAAIARGTLVPVSDIALPNLSRNDTVWMRRVIEHELPEMGRRNGAIVERLRLIEERIVLLEDRRRAVPVNDPAGESALDQFEERQRALIESEAALVRRDEDLTRARGLLEGARGEAKAERLLRFQAGRLREREQSMVHVLEVLPILAERLQSSKEERFGHYLESALRDLWHKKDRITGVEVSFSNRQIALQSANGEINRRDLSAGEKQLFAIAFIFALSKLSSRHTPFVIDTPLGRLDYQHRRRLIADFIPNASHQVLLLSTDTEIVGRLYEDLRPLLAHHYELAEYNGRATHPVQVVSA